MDFLFGLGATIFVILCLYTAYPGFTVLVGIGGTAYLIYRAILGSNWLVRVEHNAKVRELDHQQDARIKEWENVTLPTTEEFLRSVPIAPSSPFIVYNASSTIAAAYGMANFDQTKMRPAEAQATVQRFVSAAHRGLVNYELALPAPLRAKGPGLFQYHYTPTSDELRPANQALADHFRHFTEILPTEAEVEPRPEFHVWDEDKIASERREHERKLKAYDKYLQDIWDAQTPEQQLFSGSALYSFADSFAPEPTVVPFDVPYKERFAGTWIIAPSGQGKTNLMWWLIDEDRKRRGTVVIMDSKGTLLNSYRGYSDVVVIDPKRVKINPFQIGDGDHAIDFVEYIFSLIAVGMYPKQQSLFYPVLRLVTKVPNGSLNTFKKILILGWRALNLSQYIQQCDTTTREFFTLGTFDDPKYKETKQELIWRLDLLLSKPAMQSIFNSDTTTVDFFQLLDSGKTILIDNNINTLGVNGAEFFGRFFLALTWMLAVTRTNVPDAQKMPVHFYIDEAQTVIANDAKVPTILDECRSQMIALTMGHQRINRIESGEVKDALYNCAVRFASVDNDAATIANRFGLDAEQLRLPPHKFACYVRGHTPKAVILDIPFYDLTQFPPAPPETSPEPLQSEPDPIPEPPKKKQKPFKKDRARKDEVEDF